MKRLYVLLVFAACVVGASSQALKCDDGNMHWEANFTAGLNTDGYQFDLGIAYFPLQYLGIKTQLGSAGEIVPVEYWGDDEYDSRLDYAARFKSTSSLVVRSPKLINWKNQGGGFYLFAEPGIILSPGASGSHRAEWVSWDLKTGINLQVDRLIFFIGYGISDYSLYSGCRHDYRSPSDHGKFITNSGFIGGGYKF